MAVSSGPIRRTSRRAEAAVRLEVFARDGFTCRACGWSPPVPPGYDGTRTLGQPGYRKPNGRPGCKCLELDHIVPVKFGGRFVVSNLQTLCNSCNVRKGVKV